MQGLMDPTLSPAAETGMRARWFDIIYRHDTPQARQFDLVLIAAIVASVTVIVLDSDPELHAAHGTLFRALEWLFTLAFTLEYAARLWVLRRPVRYAVSLWGVIDLLSILPLYLSVLVPGAQSLLVVRSLRMLRLFRILKLTQYVEEGGVLVGALWRSRRKIFVFLSAVLTIVVVFGAIMYVVEGPEHGFNSIPTAMYWAIVTMATVGFGDIAPGTPLGRFVTAILILIGYSIIAVPTGIYTAELASSMREAGSTGATHDDRRCTACGLAHHAPDARFCRGCGAPLG